MKQRKVVLDPSYIDDEEREIIEAYNDAYENQSELIGEGLEQRKKELVQIAKNTLKKKSIGIRLNRIDLEKIQARAKHQGIPYQTLISSILHQYAEGTLERTE